METDTEAAPAADAGPADPAEDPAAAPAADTATPAPDAKADE